MLEVVGATPLLAVNCSYEVPQLDPAFPVGIVVVGQSQAGKSTTLRIVGETLDQLTTHSDSVLEFPLSNGFRAVTAEMLKSHGIDLATSGYIGQKACKEMVRRYSQEMTADDKFIDRLYCSYARPRDEAVLRNDAVNSAVAYVSEDPVIHPLVIKAATQYLRVAVGDPKSVDRLVAPSAVIIDGRNADELSGLLTSGNVAFAGLFALTCSEDDSVRRQSKMWDAPEHVLLKAIAQQIERNRSDKERASSALGPTTMPKDLLRAIELDRITADAASDIGRQALFASGLLVAGNPAMGIHIATDNGRVGIADAHRLVPAVVHGMVRGAQRLVLKTSDSFQ